MPIRICTTPEKKDLGRLALESARADPEVLRQLLRDQVSVRQARRARRPRFRRRRDGEHRGDLLSRDRSARRDATARRSRTRKTHRVGPRARDGAPMVRRSRHDAVVGRHLAERRLRDVDGEQAARRCASRLEHGGRRSAREPDRAQPRFAEGDAPDSRARRTRRPRSTRRSTRSRTRRAPPCCE